MKIDTKTSNSCLLFGLLFLVCALFSFTGCAPVISKQLRGLAAKDLTLSTVLKNPDAYKGKVILWSGVIINSVNLKKGTMIEVLQKPADRRGRPIDVDDSEGRFLVLNSGYLDVAIYRQGRKVTVAGEIQGKKIQSLGEIEYTYPLISAKEIYLWRVETESVIYYTPPYWYYPFRNYPYQR
ncbi:MAG: Slp family lipoprotein [Deltaproteobacteria bacterium]|nr:Slp family lipoprotein [Deltaproteobacteria bacterium]